MRTDNYVVKKRNAWWSLLKAIIIIAAIAFVAYKIYDKFFKKKVQQSVLNGVENGEAELSEASAQDAIADAE